jgi:osmotically inducible lipoprotein OsmB
VKKILLASTFAIALAGCGQTQTDRTLTGAALGGVAGAAIGGAATGTGGGAAAGAAIGALGGAAIGANTGPRYGRYDRCYIDDYGREICRGY